MYFAHDPDHRFYYMGTVEPHPAIYRQWMEEFPLSAVSLDTETISLREKIAIGIGVAVSPDIAFYFPLFPEPSVATPWKILKDDRMIKIWHNALFDYASMQEYEISAENVRDTSVMSRLQLHKDNSLTDLTFLHQMPVYNAGDVLKEHGAKTMLELPEEVVARKCMQDAMATYKLHDVLLPQTNREYFDVEMQTIPLMVRMSYRGIGVDQELRQRFDDQLTADVDSLYQICQDTEGFNPGSPQQVSHILAKRGAYNVFTRLPFTKDKYGRRTQHLSTAEETLEQMDDPMANLILSYRKHQKLLGTYIRPWANSDRAYTRYHLDAATGRPSSTGAGVGDDRNMQNLPGKDSPNRISLNVREVLVPDSGVWTDVDFSQLELRILAFLSGDREMQYIFSLPTYLPDGSKNPEADIHQKTADFIKIPRKIAKNVGFAMVYGGTDQTLMETAHIRDLRRCSELRSGWFQLYPEAGSYIQQRLRDVELGATYSTTWFGRKMRIPDEFEGSLDSRQRKYINYQIQGTAADMLKRGLVALKDLDIALQVHDELLVDGYIQMDRFKVLESIAPFKSPVQVKYLVRWE